jgi:hypothetical protein
METRKWKLAEATSSQIQVSNFQFPMSNFKFPLFPHLNPDS